MGKSKVLTGSPWHVEKMTRQENDPRRHRTRCVHYDSKTKYCSYRIGSCMGSAHCTHYKERKIAPAPSPVVKQPPKKTFPPFEGVRMIAIDDIEIDTTKYKKPSQQKINQLMAQYKKTGAMDKPIVISCRENAYWLEDKYLRYYVAKLLGLKEIPAKIGTAATSAREDRIKKVGTHIVHKTLGTGVITAVNGDLITVRFDDGQERKLSVDSCIKGNIISTK